MDRDDLRTIEALLGHIRGGLAVIAALCVAGLALAFYWLSGFPNEPGWAKFMYVIASTMLVFYVMRVIEPRA